MNALEGGACPDLEQLDLNKVGMGDRGASALIRALASSSLPCLESINVGLNETIGDDAMSRLISTLGNGGHPYLRSISAADTGMGYRAGQALVLVLQNDGWPELKALGLLQNPRLGDVVGIGMAGAFAGGAGSRLEKLVVRDIGLTEVGIRRLLEALRGGACPMLEVLWVDHWENVNWDGVISCREKRFKVF